jgi:hypothetical protein
MNGFRILSLLVLTLLTFASRMPAQDPFEIHIYEYEPMTRGQYSLEAHVNGNAEMEPVHARERCCPPSISFT